MPTEINGWLKTWKELRFMQLFVFSIAALLAQAVFYGSNIAVFIISLLYLNVMYAALTTTNADKKVIYLLFIIWVLIFVERHFLTNIHWLVFVLSEVLGMILLMISIIYIFRYVLFSKKITTDILFASMVNYLLMAMLFARIYAVIDFVSPHSFSYSDKLLSTDGALLNTHFSYFSLVTIATLGYGDIVPLHPFAQMVAAVEAVVGQFYVAMVVAWLVSMHVVHNSKPVDKLDG